MSNLNPGGSPGNLSYGARVFGEENIKAACQRNKREQPNNSIANQRHQHTREQARRLRQAARKAAKNAPA